MHFFTCSNRFVFVAAPFKLTWAVLRLIGQAHSIHLERKKQGGTFKLAIFRLRVKICEMVNSTLALIEDLVICHGADRTLVSEKCVWCTCLINSAYDFSRNPATIFIIAFSISKRVDFHLRLQTMPSVYIVLQSTMKWNAHAVPFPIKGERDFSTFVETIKTQKCVERWSVTDWSILCFESLIITTTISWVRVYVCASSM